MSEPVKIAVIVEGGVVTRVLTAGVAVEFVIVDYDVEGSDPCEPDQRDVPQGDGKTARAIVYRGAALPHADTMMLHDLAG